MEDNLRLLNKFAAKDIMETNSADESELEEMMNITLDEAVMMMSAFASIPATEGWTLREFFKFCLLDDDDPIALQIKKELQELDYEEEEEP